MSSDTTHLDKPKAAARYTDGLPPDLAREIALNRRISPKEYAELLDLSIDQARRLWRAGKIPQPTPLGARKLGIQLGVAMDAAKARAA